MKIKGVSGVFNDKEFTVEDSLVIGRKESTCNVVFPKSVEGISRAHCRIEERKSKATLTDLGSSYGTYLNGDKLEPNVPHILHDGDTFYLGDRSNMFTVTGIKKLREERYETGKSEQMMSGSRMRASYISDKEEHKDFQTIISDKKLRPVIIATAAILLIMFFVILSQRSSMKDKEKQIAEQQQEISNKEQALVQKQSEIDAQQNAIDSMQREIDSQQLQISEQQGELNAKQAEIDAKDDEGIDSIGDLVGGIVDIFF